jgi:hypothetical protein
MQAGWTLEGKFLWSGGLRGSCFVTVTTWGTMLLTSAECRCVTRSIFPDINHKEINVLKFHSTVIRLQCKFLQLCTLLTGVPGTYGNCKRSFLCLMTTILTMQTHINLYPLLKSVIFHREWEFLQEAYFITAYNSFSHSSEMLTW